VSHAVVTTKTTSCTFSLIRRRTSFAISIFLLCLPSNNSHALSTMAPMKAMKSMKSASTGMTATAVYSSVAETTGLKSKDVKAVMEGYMGVCADQLKKNGTFKIAGMLNLKLKKKAAQPARKGVNPFTKEPCVFKAKPASKTVRALAMKKLKTAVN
jgi:DNA-binding protein HU-beta